MPAQRAVDDIALGGCDAARILRWAVSHGVISVAAERVLAHVAFGDYTDAEIAQRCGGTTAFTKKTRQRALHDLREHPGARALLTA